MMEDECEADAGMGGRADFCENWGEILFWRGESEGDEGDDEGRWRRRL